MNLLVIVNDLHVRRSWRSSRPLEANPPLLVDSNAVLPQPVALERLEPVSGQRRQISQRRGGFQPIQLPPRRTRKPGEAFDPLSLGEVLGVLVPVADNHGSILPAVTRYVKRNFFPICPSPTSPSSAKSPSS